MAMPSAAKDLGLHNSGWFKKKYQSEAERKVVYAEKQKTYYSKHKPKFIERSWRRQIERVGCSVELYAKLYAQQFGLCAICGLQDNRKLSVDHCHRTGKIRGLLCSRCNKALGMVEDNIELLRLMEEYLCHPKM